MLRLRTFGSVGLETADGRAVGAVLAQPKRLALLAYLAAAQPAGVHRRDNLLALFWPDLDDDRARDALNQALRFLRQALGAETLVSRGAEEVGIDPARLWCDAVAFRAALDASRPDQAMELYRGEFLQGFFIEEGGGFEEWMERERAALHDLAVRGARRLSDQLAADGSLTLAMTWGKRALELAPDDERALRRLLRLFDKAGDRAGAFRLYEAFARRFEEEFGAQPSPETRALAEQLKAGQPLAEERGAPPRPAVEPPRTTPKDFASELGDRYRIVRKLGAGGMATVYLAHDVKHDREVALKLLRPEVAEGLARERFVREIRIAGRLQHPNIVPLFDSGVVGDRLFYVMAHIEGETLRERLLREGRFDFEPVRHLLREIAGALAYAHERGVIHRDIKPENILLIDRRAVLADFGIARAAHFARTPAGHFDPTLTLPGTSLGTPAYMAPEQAAGSGEVDGRADLYALGVLAYEMIAGRPPFTGQTAQEILAAQLAVQPLPITELRPETPPGLAALVMRCLEKQPEARPQSAAEVEHALETGLPAAPPATAPEPAQPTPREASSRPRVWPRRRAVLAWAGLALAGVAGVVVATRRLGHVRLDPALHIVLPFRQTDSSTSLVLDGRACATLAHEALRRWSDVSRVDQLRVADLLERDGTPRTLTQALAVARAAGAGRLLWGQVSGRGDSLVVEGVLYDVGKPERALRENRIAMARLDEGVETRFALMIDSLVASGQPVPLPGTTQPFAAVKVFTLGVEALTEWDLTRAQARFRAALEIAPQYPAAAF
ncbi:MAG TPA: protein kinase, partial [Gemmatimonadales bacterium]|nr:protein kinase [Gemmatimonadales bacterium]